VGGAILTGELNRTELNGTELNVIERNGTEPYHTALNNTEGRRKPRRPERKEYLEYRFDFKNITMRAVEKPHILLETDVFKMMLLRKMILYTWNRQH